MTRTLSYVLCPGVGALAVTYAWHTLSGSIGSWSNGAQSCSVRYLVPSGSSIQRVVVSGGLTNFATVQTQTGGRQQSQSTIFSDFFVQQLRNNSLWDYYLWRHFSWNRQGSWGSGSPTNTNEAASFEWSTPWDAFEWSADVRMKGTGTNGVGILVNSQSFGQNTDGILGPVNQPSGELFMRVLTSTKS